MDLEAVHAHRFSKRTLIQIVDYVIDKESRLKQLVNLLVMGNAAVAGRSSWSLSYCAELRPNWIRPHIGKLIRFMEKGDGIVAARRGVMRTLQFAQIPARFHARALNVCFRLLADPHESIAVKVFAMTVAAGVAKENPELKKELRIVIEDQLPYAGPGFRARARKVLK